MIGAGSPSLADEELYAQKASGIAEKHNKNSAASAETRSGGTYMYTTHPRASSENSFNAAGRGKRELLKRGPISCAHPLEQDGAGLPGHFFAVSTG